MSKEAEKDRALSHGFGEDRRDDKPPRTSYEELVVAADALLQVAEMDERNEAVCAGARGRGWDAKFLRKKRLEAAAKVREALAHALGEPKPVVPSAGVALNSELKCRDGRPLLKELANIVAFLDSEEAHPSARIIEDVAAFLGSLSGKHDRFDAGRQVEEPSEDYVLRLLGRIGHLERQLRDAEAIIRTPHSATQRRDDVIEECAKAIEPANHPLLMAATKVIRALKSNAPVGPSATEGG